MDGAALSAKPQDPGPEAWLQGPKAPRALPRAGLFGLPLWPRLSGLALLLGLHLPGALSAPALILPPSLALSLWATPLAAESGSSRSGEDKEDEEDDEDRDEDEDEDDDDRDDDDDSGGGGGGSDDDDDDSGGGGGGGNHDDDDGAGGGSGGNSGGNSGSNGGGGSEGGQPSSSKGSSGNGGRSGGAAAGGGAPSEALFAEDVLRITFKDGASESLRGGVYEKRSASGEVIERRRARAADRNRLEALRAGGTPGTGSVIDSVSVVSRSQRALQFTDRRGWRETLIGTRYTLTDPQGRVVTRRNARAKDYARLSSLLGL